MVWIQKEDLEGAGWKGLMIDGYLGSKKQLEDIYKRVYNARPSFPYPSTTDRWSIDELFKATAEETRVRYLKKIKQGGRSDYDCPCDLFLLKLGEDRSILPPLNQFHEEVLHDHNRSSYRVLLLFQKGCEQMDECATNLVRALKFRVKPRRDYKDYERFVKVGEDLIQRMLESYVYPCIVTENNLRSLGFDCYP